MTDHTEAFKKIIEKHCGQLTNDDEREVVAPALQAATDEINAYCKDNGLSDDQFWQARELVRKESFRLYTPKVKKNKRYKGMKGS